MPPDGCARAGGIAGDAVHVDPGQELAVERAVEGDLEPAVAQRFQRVEGEHAIGAEILGR